MEYTTLSFTRVLSASHQGKVVVIAKASDPRTPTAAAKLYYNVLDAGAQSASADEGARSDDKGWSDAFTVVPLPSERRPVGMSLVTVKDQAAPSDFTFQVISDGTYLHVFRAYALASGPWVVYANRYALLEAVNAQGTPVQTLKLVTEARFRQSRRKDSPAGPLDTPSYQDMDDALFIEPTAVFNAVQPEGGWFTVALTPSELPGRQRWQFIYATQTGLAAASYVRGEGSWVDLTQPCVEGSFAVWTEPSTPASLLVAAGMPTSALFRRQEVLTLANDATHSTVGESRLFLSAVMEDAAHAKHLLALDFPLDDRGVIELPSAPIVVSEMEPANTALRFDGTGDRVAIPGVPAPASALTLTLWHRHLAGNGTLAVYGDASGNIETAGGFELSWLDGTITARLCSGPGGAVVSLAAAAPTVSQWHHLALVYQFAQGAGSVSLYIDGVIGKLPGTESDASAAFNHALAAGSGPLFLGGVPSGASVNGDLDEVRLYNAALEPAQFQMFQELDKSEMEALIGYWKLDDPYTSGATVAADSCPTPHPGTVRGAQWITQTAPVRSVAPKPTWSKLSPGMGLIDFGASDFDDPTSLIGADGRVHLYSAAQVPEVSPSERTQVALQFDATVARAQLALPWSAAAGAAGTQYGTVLLSALESGPDFNDAHVKLTSASTPALPSGTLVISHGGGTETWTGLPLDVADAVSILNGQSSDDLDTPLVRSGALRFFDTHGVQPIFPLGAAEGSVLLVSPRAAGLTPAPCALPLTEVALEASAGGTGLDATLTFTAPGAAWHLILTLAELPSAASALVPAINGVAASYDLPSHLSVSGAGLTPVPVGAGSILFVAPGGVTVTFAPSTQEAGKVDVELEVAGQPPVSRAGLPAEPAAFVQAINASGLADVVAVSSNADGRVPAAGEYAPVAGTTTGAEPCVAVGGAAEVVRLHAPPVLADGAAVDLSGLVRAIPYRASGVLAPQTVTARFAQGVTRSGPTPPLTVTASAFVSAAAFDAPANGTRPMLMPGTATLFQAGNFGGWVPVPPSVCGAFTATQLAWTSTDPTLAPAALPPGDFTIEAWVDPGALYAPDAARLVTIASAADEASLTLVAPSLVGGVMDFPSAGQAVVFWGGEVKVVDPAAQTAQPPSSIASLLPALCAKVDPTKLIAAAAAGNDGTKLFFVKTAQAADLVVLDAAGGVVCGPADPSTYVQGWPEAWPHAVECAVSWSATSMYFIGQGKAAPVTKSSGTWTLGPLGTLAATFASWPADPRWQEVTAAIGPVTVGGAAKVYLFSGWEVLRIDVATATVDEPPSSAQSWTDLLWPLHVRAAAKWNAVTTEGAIPPPVPSTGWTHLALACSDNAAIRFDGAHKAVVQKSDGLGPASAFSIDAMFVWDGPAGNGTQCLLSKKSSRLYGGTPDINYTLAIDASGAPVLTFMYFNGQARILVPKRFDQLSVTPGSPCYLCAYVSLELADGSGSAPTTRTLQYGAYVRELLGPAPGQGQQATVTGLPLRTILLSSDAKVALGAEYAEPPTGQANTGYFRGKVAVLRFWDRSLADDAPTLAMAPTALPADGPIGDWTCASGEGTVLADASGSHDATLDTAEMRAGGRIGSRLDLYVNGAPLSPSPYFLPSTAPDAPEGIALGGVRVSAGVKESFVGKLEEVRVWSSARTREQLDDLRNVQLTGAEDDLAAYWSFNAGSGLVVKDDTGKGHELSVGPGTDEDTFWRPSTAPVGDEAPEIYNLLQGRKTPWLRASPASPAAAEYAEVQPDADGILRGVMKRMYAALRPKAAPATGNDCVLRTGFAVGETELTYIGQVQTKPQVIGYIEGAPPVPSENLTRPYYQLFTTYASYAGVSSVALQEADSTTVKYSADKDTGFDMSTEAGIGGMWSANISVGGMFVVSQAFLFKKKAGLQMKFANALSWIKGGTLGVGTTKSLTSSIQAAGDWEGDAAHPDTWLNPAVGRRYVPANLGFALVKSSVADVYALRLARTGTLVAMQLVPNQDVPEDYNVVTFPMSPHYVKQGTLDGKVGFVNDPDYPDADQVRGSYFRARETADLVAQIESEEAHILSQYATFDAGASGRRQSATHFQEGDPATGPSDALEDGLEVPYDWANDRNQRNMVNTYVWTASGGFFAESEQTSVSRQEHSGGKYAFQGMAGLEWHAEAAAGAGLFLDAKALFGGHINTSVTKQKEDGRDFSIAVKAAPDALLHTWDGTRYSPAPVPGKVDAYRFKTFYLAPKSEHFEALFDDVIDRSWLENSTSPDAAAMRAARTRDNHVWRVLHRVTYVSRVPPVYAAVPAESDEELHRPLVNVADNVGLLERVRAKLPSPPARTDLAKAVTSVLRGSGDGTLAAAIPWWSGFLTSAAIRDSPEYRALNELTVATLQYVTDYYDAGGFGAT